MKRSDPTLYPPLTHRLYSVWYRHMRVYTRNILSNGLPPFLEPLLFLLGIGVGLGQYIDQPMGDMDYIDFLGTGLLVTAAMYTASFECTFGTFIRLEFDKTYDGMLAAPITVNNLIVGEIIWAGTKGLFFSFAVLCVLVPFGIVPLPQGLLTPLVGFLTGLMFASMALLVTSFVKSINHFNFFHTGLLSPMFFFSGVVFPVEKLPAPMRVLAEVVPLTHTVRLVRAVSTSRYHPGLLGDTAYIVLFIAVFATLAVRRLRKRLVT